jgi:hypothetical protein
MKVETEHAVDSMSPLAVMELMTSHDNNSGYYPSKLAQQDEIARQRRCLVENINDLCDCCDS